MKKVSIIVPVYNAEKYLKDCITSLLQQSYQNIEIILIDDGSLDSSGKIINSFMEIDTRIFSESIVNSGVSAARNEGLSLATGAYIMFVDSDDRIHNDMVAELVKAIEKGPFDMAVCGFEMNYFRKNKACRRVKIIPKVKDILTNQDFCDTFSDMFENKTYLSPWSKLYKHEILKAHTIKFEEDISIGEDMLWNYAYLRCTQKIAVIEKAYYYYNVGSSTASTKSFDITRIKNNEYLYQRAMDFIEDMHIPKGKSAIAKYYLQSSMILVEKFIREENIDDVIKRILISEYTEKACSVPAAIKNVELLLYQAVFKCRSCRAIKLLGFTRILVKKILRG